MQRTRQRKRRAVKPLLRYSRLRGTLSWQDTLTFRGAITIAADGTISNHNDTISST